MAFSKSIKCGQAPATCNFCEEETKIKWKCINCDVLMCAKCKDKIHAKLKNNKDHNVIDIKEVGIYRGDLDFSVLKCEKHSGQSCVMFCVSCDTLVCTLCIGNIHNGHVLVETRRGFNIRKDKFKSDQKKIKEKIGKLIDRKNKITTVYKKNSATYKDLAKRIDAKNVEVKKATDKQTEKLKSELNKKWRDLPTEEINKLDEVIVNLQGLLRSNVDDIALSNDIEKLFIDSSKLSSALKVAESNLRLGTISFLPGQIPLYSVGSLQVVSKNGVDVRIVKQFQTDISRAFFLSFCPDDSLWISDASVLQKVKPVAHTLTIESTLNLGVYRMAVYTTTGDLLLVSDQGSGLKQISNTTGKLSDSIYLLQPGWSLYSALHVTKDCKVIVGVNSARKLWPATGRRAIIVMNQKGEHEHIYEHDKYNIRLFTHPVSITSTDTGNICVVDELNQDSRGRVVVLNMDGDILHIYTGQHDINDEDKLFKPVKIDTTPSDNIIVTELNNNILHILNNYGHLIAHYNVGDIGIDMPFSFSFTRITGQLYIGCNNPEGSSEKAKLFEVHISGC
ncbi:uncharacterized protein [Mytilus edulis]|uniref:uncharacterized protein n=1 Tax=Mytilus edulis TaxID=6550 RepID=UPI0039EE9FC7